MAAAPPIKVKVQIFCGDEIALGPGKADLLDAIVAHGSISAAARAMGMSYRRAWLLVDAMNRCWASPLVEAVPGGSHDRGATLTAAGREVLRHYRALQDAAQASARETFTAGLAGLLADSPRPGRQENP